MARPPASAHQIQMIAVADTLDVLQATERQQALLNPSARLVIDFLDEKEKMQLKTMRGAASLFTACASPDTRGRVVDGAMHLDASQTHHLTQDMQSINDTYRSAGGRVSAAEELILSFLRLASQKNLGLFVLSHLDFDDYE